MQHKKADPFYKTARWEHVRDIALRRDGYKCKYCEISGKIVQAQCVHHIFPREDFPEYRYELWNMISLCNRCHNEMHDHFGDRLSTRGLNLMRGKAVERGIVVTSKDETILVVGLSGSGKSTYCLQNIGKDALCYDMDAIASAFRLRMPHEEYFKPARKMANDFLFGFLAKAHDYSRRIFVIRTAPRLDEVESIKPTEVIYCTKRHVKRDMDDEQAAQERLDDLKAYCERSGLPITLIGADDPRPPVAP
jgi:hypothetical protein